MKQVILYGLSGADKQYKVECYFCIFDKETTLKKIKYHSEMMRIYNPNVKMVFAIDNRPGLKSEYTHSFKENSIESCAVFKDTLEREGLRII